MKYCGDIKKAIDYIGIFLFNAKDGLENSPTTSDLKERKVEEYLKFVKEYFAGVDVGTSIGELSWSFVQSYKGYDVFSHEKMAMNDKDREDVISQFIADSEKDDMVFTSTKANFELLKRLNKKHDTN